MNDEQLLIDEMNDFEDFMENADVEEIKKEHGLTTKNFPSFELGPYGNANIVKVTSDSVYLTSEHMAGGVSFIPFNLFSDCYGDYLIAYDNEVHNAGLDISSLPIECVYRLENSYRLRFYKSNKYNPVVEVVQGEIVENPQDIHKRICDNFDIVEKSLYEICVDLKTIRDNKFYNQLGYDTFESYCLECFNIKRRQVYNYISIAENLSSEFVQPVAQIGMRKLYCLSRLTDEERTELLESTDIEHTPVKQVEQKAKEIKNNREVNSIWNGSSSINVLDSKIKDDDNSSTYQSSSKEKEFVSKYGKEMNDLFLVIRGNLKKLSKDFNIYSCHLDFCYSSLNYTDLFKNFGFNGLFSVDSFFKDVDFNKFINTVKALSMWVDNYKCISRGKCTHFDVNDIKDVLCGLSDGDDKNVN